MVVVVPADLMSRGGANEALTLNGASGSDSGDDDLSMSSFISRMRAREDLLYWNTLGVGAIKRKQIAESRKSGWCADKHSCGSLFSSYRADHMMTPRTGRT